MEREASKATTDANPLGPYAFVSHETSVEAIWSLAAKHWKGVLDDENVWMVPDQEICVKTQREFKQLAKDVDLRSLGIHRDPADLLVPNKSCYSRGAHAKFHVWKDFFPLHSFVRVHERIFVSSPYFSVLQLATAHRANRISQNEAKLATEEIEDIKRSLGLEDADLTESDLVRWNNIARFVRAAQVLCDFSGTYRYVPDEQQGMSDASIVYQTKPMMSPKSFLEYVTQMPKSKGVERGRAVAAAAFASCASPMETMLALMLSLPTSMGGFGIPRPEANWKIPIPPDRQRFCSQSTMVGDLCWPEQRVMLEYYGWNEHFGAGPRKVADDAARANSLTALGWTVYHATFEQVNTLEGISLLARQLQDALGMELPEPTDLELVWRARLLALLLPPVRHT